MARKKKEEIKEEIKKEEKKVVKHYIIKGRKEYEVKDENDLQF